MLTKRISFKIILGLLIFSSLLTKNVEVDNYDSAAMSAAFEEFKNRKIYNVLTQEILDSISDNNLVQTVFDNIYQIIEADTSGVSEFEKVSKLSNGQKAVFTSWVVEAEVNNGGFNQFYFNSSGEYANLAVLGFETIGAYKYAELMKNANKLFAEIKPDLEKFDDGTLEGFSASYENNPLDSLDTEFYKLSEHEGLISLMQKYIRKNSGEFIATH